MKVLGLILLVAGILCFAIPSITFFTRDRIVDGGYFHIDVDKPHTILLNPAVGLLMAGAGVILLVFGQRKSVSA
jgi:hypothetical protein